MVPPAKAGMYQQKTRPWGSGASEQSLSSRSDLCTPHGPFTWDILHRLLFAAYGTFVRRACHERRVDCVADVNGRRREASALWPLRVDSGKLGLHCLGHSHSAWITRFPKKAPFADVCLREMQLDGRTTAIKAKHAIRKFHDAPSALTSNSHFCKEW